jgi:CHAP domain
MLNKSHQLLLLVTSLGVLDVSSTPIASAVNSIPSLSSSSTNIAKSPHRKIRASADTVPHADSLPSIATLGIKLDRAHYQASGNQLIAWNEQILGGAHPFECVEFVYGRAIERGLIKNNHGIATVLVGNADTWSSKIANSNYRDRLKNKPRANSLVVWDADRTFSWQEGNTIYTWTSDPVAGHVAFVEKVYTDGSFLITEGIHQAQPSVRLIKAGNPVGTAAKFIYL